MKITYLEAAGHDVEGGVEAEGVGEVDDNNRLTVSLADLHLILIVRSRDSAETLQPPHHTTHSPGHFPFSFSLSVGGFL